MVDELRRQSEDVTRLYEEIDQRIGETGMDGIVGLLTVTRHVEAALGAVSSDELAAAVTELRSLVERLVRIDAELRAARTVKSEISDDSET